MHYNMKKKKPTIEIIRGEDIEAGEELFLKAMEEAVREKTQKELDAASQRVSGYSREQRSELEAHARKVAGEKPKWKKVSKSDAGDPLPVCNCMDNWKVEGNVCPIHG